MSEPLLLQQDERLQPIQAVEDDELGIQLAVQLVEARSRRFRHFDQDMFGEPAWNMLLELLVSERRRHKCSVTDLCLSSHTPSSTALRWLQVLERRGLVCRERDPRDGRRTFVLLSPAGRKRLLAYLLEESQCRSISGSRGVELGV